MCYVVYSTGAICKGHHVPGIINEADRYEGLCNVRGVQYIPESDVREALAIGDAYWQVTSPDGSEGTLVSCIYRFGHDDSVVDQGFLVGCHVLSGSRVI